MLKFVLRLYQQPRRGGERSIDRSGQPAFYFSVSVLAVSWAVGHFPFYLPLLTILAVFYVPGVLLLSRASPSSAITLPC